jgi:hypothetical protein
MDFIFLLLLIVIFAMTLGLVAFCTRLGDKS